MRVSAKIEYACIAMLELASSYGTGEPIRIRSIAADHGVPARFLVQILLQLKAAGLVSSTRGAAGGYQLVSPPAELTLADVLSVVEGQEMLPSPEEASSPSTRVLRRVWHEMAAAEQELLRSISFADLLERAQGEAESMYYI